MIKPDHCLVCTKKLHCSFYYQLTPLLRLRFPTLYFQVGSAGAAILPVLHDAVGEWGAHTLRNVTYLTRDLTHEGGGHQHLNIAAGHNHHNHVGHSHAASQGRHRAVDGSAAAGDEVQVVGGNSPHKAKDFYDLSFLAQLNEEDKVSS